MLYKHTELWVRKDQLENCEMSKQQEEDLDIIHIFTYFREYYGLLCKTFFVFLEHMSLS